ncbi:dopamine receptor 2-like isoform X2 [Anastrepha ludens]|uniref:dopamine receptor 2-like isoform X2 n=1 Tax=Anastrepha ludens TaxID=28586 RepID=UPI0023AFE098|nr:dopamine receptor 2-like isoform X2 [Anastrepha ludens]
MTIMNNANSQGVASNFTSTNSIIAATNNNNNNNSNANATSSRDGASTDTAARVNDTLYYWKYTSEELSEFSLVAPELEPSMQQLSAQQQPASGFSYHQSNTRTDNHTTEAQAEPPPAFYTSFNISDDIFDYFNGFLESAEQQQQQLLTTTSAEILTTSTSTVVAANASLTSYIHDVSNGTRDLRLGEFLGLLPNDRISLLSFLFLFSFATVFGNTLVILAVIRERYLHTATNYFITSLAVADCLVGLVVMPFSALYEVLENTWFFGTDWCDIWRSLDVLFSTASILNLCVISLDRYWAITDPFTYPMRMTVKRSAALICAVWVCSSAISFPAIVWWRAARDGEMPAYKCTFTEHLGYLVFSSTISFYLPLLVMVFTYCRIYRAAVIQTRSLKIGTKQVLMASGELQLTLRIHRGGTTREPSTSASHHPTIHGSLGGAPSGGSDGSQHHRHHSHLHSAHHNHSASGTTSSTPEEPDDEPLSALHNNGLARHRHMGKNFSLSRKLAKFAKEKKAAKTLGIVMGVFIVCWLPFFVVNLLSGFCVECIEHEEIVSAIVTWLGWINSCMNPVIYACWSRDFRRAFVRLLCVCCPRKIRRKYQPTMRSKSQCHVAAAMVAASTPFNYSSVQQFDGNRSIM